jgi:transcription elongation GreA/GreB family factor
MSGRISARIFPPKTNRARWIVGEPEADAHRGKISVSSPIAQSLIGKSKGVTVEVIAMRDDD